MIGPPAYRAALACLCRTADRAQAGVELGPPIIEMNKMRNEANRLTLLDFLIEQPPIMRIIHPKQPLIGRAIESNCGSLLDRMEETRPAETAGRSRRSSSWQILPGRGLCQARIPQPTHGERGTAWRVSPADRPRIANPNAPTDGVGVWAPIDSGGQPGLFR